MATPQPAVLNRNMGQHQWYVHLSRLDGADMGVIKSAVQQLRKDCADKGINLTIGLGPSAPLGPHGRCAQRFPALRNVPLD